MVSHRSNPMTSPEEIEIPVGQAATFACLLEVSAPKVGNVHRGADFEDMTFLDFLLSAAAIGPVFDRAAGGQSLGKTILNAIIATQSVTAANTNLGTILLLAPLSISQPNISIHDVLGRLTTQDAHDVYRAITMVRPGGLGKSEKLDVHDAPPDDLLVAMRAAADRDLVARQFTNGFEQVLSEVVPNLDCAINRKNWPLFDAIVHVQLTLMSRHPDSLIGRKCGSRVAQESSERAAKVLACETNGIEYQAALADLDFWLRSDGNRRNPGTTADLIAAGLFVALRGGIIRLPMTW